VAGCIRAIELTKCVSRTDQINSERERIAQVEQIQSRMSISPPSVLYLRCLILQRRLIISFMAMRLPTHNKKRQERLRPTDWKGIPFENLQALPRNAKWFIRQKRFNS
jgi:hypothetical protein